MTYSVIFHREAKKDMKSMHPQVAKRVIAALTQLAQNPKMMGVILLEGQKDVYRYRVGDYRIVFRIIDSELQVLVLDVKPRGEVYKKY